MATSCPKRRVVTYKMPPRTPYNKEGTTGEPLQLSSAICSAGRYFANLAVICAFVIMSFTEISKIVLSRTKECSRYLK